MIGKKFGNLTVSKFSHFGKRNRPYWECICDCGNIKIAMEKNLKSGDCQSCGCLFLKRVTQHGMYKSRTHKIWRGMLYRCNENYSNKDYSDRGITVCDRWKESFLNFLNDMGECPKGLTIDRIDPNGNYEPNNCRWATYKEQSLNRTNTRYLTIEGVTKTLHEWAKEKDIKYDLLLSRVAGNWPLEELFRPSQKSNKTGKRMPNIKRMSDELKKQRSEKAKAQWVKAKLEGKLKL